MVSRTTLPRPWNSAMCGSTKTLGNSCPPSQVSSRSRLRPLATATVIKQRRTLLAQRLRFSIELWSSMRPVPMLDMYVAHSRFASGAKRCTCLHCQRICYANQLRSESKTVGHLPSLRRKVPWKQALSKNPWTKPGRRRKGRIWLMNAKYCQAPRFAYRAWIWGSQMGQGRRPPVKPAGGGWVGRTRTRVPIVKRGADRTESFENRARNYVQLSARRCPAPSVFFCVRDA